MKFYNPVARNYQCSVEFKCGKKYKVINRTEREAKQMYNRYIRDMLILDIKKVEWSIMK